MSQTSRGDHTLCQSCLCEWSVFVSEEQERPEPWSRNKACFCEKVPRKAVSWQVLTRSSICRLDNLIRPKSLVGGDREKAKTSSVSPVTSRNSSTLRRVNGTKKHNLSERTASNSKTETSSGSRQHFYQGDTTFIWREKRRRRGKRQKERDSERKK